jgi:hypothetical protein
MGMKNIPVVKEEVLFSSADIGLAPRMAIETELTTSCLAANSGGRVGPTVLATDRECLGRKVAGECDTHEHEQAGQVGGHVEPL